jgi:hypothetical protein
MVVFDIGGTDEAFRAQQELSRLSVATTQAEAMDAVHALHEIVCYAAVTVEEETVPTVKALYALLRMDGFCWPQFVLQLLETILSVDGVLESETPLMARVREEVMRGESLVRERRDDASRDVRGAAILLLSHMSEDPAVDFQRYTRECVEEPDAVLQADLAVAAAACAWESGGAVDEAAAVVWSKQALEHPNPAVAFRVGRYLLEQSIELQGVDVAGIVTAAEPLVMERRLFRTEYM